MMLLLSLSLPLPLIIYIKIYQYETPTKNILFNIRFANPGRCDCPGSMETFPFENSFTTKPSGNSRTQYPSLYTIYIDSQNRT